MDADAWRLESGDVARTHGPYARQCFFKQPISRTVLRAMREDQPVDAPVMAQGRDAKMPVLPPRARRRSLKAIDREAADILRRKVIGPGRGEYGFEILSRLGLHEIEENAPRFIGGTAEHRARGIVQGESLRCAEADAQPSMRIVAPAAYQPVSGTVPKGHAIDRGEIDIATARIARTGPLGELAREHPCRIDTLAGGGMRRKPVVGALLHLRPGSCPRQPFPALQRTEESRRAVRVIVRAGEGGDALGIRLEFLFARETGDIHTRGGPDILHRALITQHIRDDASDEIGAH